MGGLAGDLESCSFLDGSREMLKSDMVEFSGWKLAKCRDIGGED